MNPFPPNFLLKYILGLFNLCYDMKGWGWTRKVGESRGKACSNWPSTKSNSGLWNNLVAYELPAQPSELHWHPLQTFLTQYWRRKKCLTEISYIKKKEEKTPRGGLTLFFVTISSLLLQETATGLQHCLQSSQTPVIVLLRSQQLSGERNKGTFLHITHVQLAVALSVTVSRGRQKG